MPKEPTRIWITIPQEDVVHHMNLPGLTSEMLPDFCRYNPDLVSKAVFAWSLVLIARNRFNVTPIVASNAMQLADGNIESLLIVTGEGKDIERFISHMKARRLQSQFPDMEPTAYEAMKKSAFNLMRKNKIKCFSEEELHRVFKHAKEQLLYRSIVRAAIEDGFTIDSLYEQDRDRGLGR